MYQKDQSKSSVENALNWSGMWSVEGLQKISDDEIHRKTLILEILRTQNKKEVRKREETGTNSRFLILSTGWEIMIQKS